MSAESIIQVENLGKRYRICHQQQGGMRYKALRDVLADKTKSVAKRLWSLAHRAPSSALRSPLSEDFWALKDVSFEVKQGDTLGIIGRNGAGKSTLLKILSRITEPTSGRVRIKGRVASLLEVGTGFHPELTGRENIFLNGAILGMTRAEIKSKFDEIVGFAEVDRFLDTPVKRYSSGMYVRLAFAVAAHLEPEILIVDEVLAVGDAEFQKKCLGKMHTASRQEGRTVLFVSHNLQAVRTLCARAIVMEAGAKRFDDRAGAALEAYLGQTMDWSACVYETAKAPRHIRGSNLVCIERVWFSAGHARLRFADPFRVQVQIAAARPLADACFDLTFFNLDNAPIGTSFSRGAVVRSGRAVYSLTIPSLRFAPGKYYCDLAVLKGTWLRSPTVHDVVTGILHFELEFPPPQDGSVPVWYPNWGPTVPEEIEVSELEPVEPGT